MLDGIISKRTLLELLPQIDDVDQELARLEEEAAEVVTETYQELPEDTKPDGDDDGDEE